MRRFTIPVLFWTVIGFMAVLVPHVSQATSPLLEKVRLSVPSMHCELCPFTVRRALERIPGVMRAQASLSSKTATVWIRKGDVRIRDLERATDEAGYPSSLLSVQMIRSSE